MCSQCAGDYENPDATVEDLEFSDLGREKPSKALLGVWAFVLGVCGFVWGFGLAWVYPVIHRLLQ